MKNSKLFGELSRDEIYQRKITLKLWLALLNNVEDFASNYKKKEKWKL